MQSDDDQSGPREKTNEKHFRETVAMTDDQLGKIIAERIAQWKATAIDNASHLQLLAERDKE